MLIKGTPALQHLNTCAANLGEWKDTMDRKMLGDRLELRKKK